MSPFGESAAPDSNVYAREKAEYGIATGDVEFASLLPGARTRRVADTAAIARSFEEAIMALQRASLSLGLVALGGVLASVSCGGGELGEQREPLSVSCEPIDPCADEPCGTYSRCVVVPGDPPTHECIQFDPCTLYRCPRYYVCDSHMFRCMPTLVCQAGDECPSGHHCRRGNCQQDNPSVPCAGPENLRCPGRGTCFDDRSDDCDPYRGDKGCPGKCQCIFNEEGVCPIGKCWRGLPEMCGCVDGYDPTQCDPQGACCKEGPPSVEGLPLIPL